MNVYFFHIKEKFYTDTRPENLVDAVAEVSSDDTVITSVASEPAPGNTTYSLPPSMVSKVYPPVQLPTG